MTSTPGTTQNSGNINHQVMMGHLVKHHDMIASLIPKQRTVHYVDIPMHGNIGDLLIMQGTLEFLKINEISPEIIATFFNFNPAWINDGDVVLFHGGGNFGDLYPGPQQLRERTIVLRPDNRIIILPQTIHFQSEQAYDKCCRQLARHKDLHIFVRDQRSYELARPMSSHVYLAPDMAHQLWPIHNFHMTASLGSLGVLRTDDETVRGLQPAGLHRVTDWPLLVGKREAITRNIHRFLRVLHLARIDRYIATPASKLWIKRAGTLVKEAIDLYGSYDHITTDRLHGHILACLMSIPNTLIDNSYGKNNTYAKAWTAASDIVQLASTRTEKPCQ